MKNLAPMVALATLLASQLTFAAKPVVTGQPCESQAKELVAQIAKLSFGSSISNTFQPHVVEQELVATYGNGNTKDWRYLIDMQDANGASLAASHGGEGSFYEVKLESLVQPQPAAPLCQIQSIVFKPLD